MDHHRQIEGCDDFLGASQHLVIVGASDFPRQARLDAGDDVAVLRDGLPRRADIGAVDVHGVAAGQDAGAPDVDQHPGRLRRRFGDGNHFSDAIRSLRSRIDKPRHAVRETQRGPICDAGGMRVDVEQARDDDLAARIKCFRGLVCDVCLHGRNAAAGDRHVEDRIYPERGVDHTPALDDQIVPRRRREEVGHVGERRRPRGGCTDKLAPAQRGQRLHGLILAQCREPRSDPELTGSGVKDVGLAIALLRVPGLERRRDL